MQTATDTTAPAQEPIINELEFNVIYDKVLRHIRYMDDMDCVRVLWDEALPYVQALLAHPRPQFYISTIVNTLSRMDEKCRTMGMGSIRKREILALYMYIVLYYLMRDDKLFTKDFEPRLKSMLSMYRSSDIWNHGKTENLLKELPLPSELRDDDQPQQPQEEPEGNGVGPRLCVKVLIRMYEKLWARMGMSGCNNRTKAEFLAATSGYSVEVLEDRMARNFELTDRDHKTDVEVANNILLKMGVKNLIKIDKTRRK